MIRAIVLDLDDTLYLERDYVRSGFTHVAYLEARGLANSAEVFAFLWAGFEAGERHHALSIRCSGDGHRSAGWRTSKHSSRAIGSIFPTSSSGSRRHSPT